LLYETFGAKNTMTDEKKPKQDKYIIALLFGKLLPFREQVAPAYERRHKPTITEYPGAYTEW
jgi:hypothetical protein